LKKGLFGSKSQLPKHYLIPIIAKQGQDGHRSVARFVVILMTG
jgi:hypothetical protein